MAKTGRPLTTDEIKRIQGMWMTGMGIREVSHRCGVSDFTVRKYCRDLERPESTPISVEERTRLLGGW